MPHLWPDVDRAKCAAGEIIGQNILRPLLSQAVEAANDSRPTPPATEPAPSAPPIHKPRTEPLKPPRPLTQPNPTVNVTTSQQPSGYTVGLFVGFAVIVLGAAILVGVNLARQTTTEAKATKPRHDSGQRR